MKFKRFLAAFLIAASALTALAGCQSASNGPTDTTAPTGTSASTEKETTASTQSSGQEDAETTPETTADTEPETQPGESETQAPGDDMTESDTSDARLTELLSNKTKLRFDEKGQFKIMMLSDLHLYGNGLSAAGMQNIKCLVEHEEPDIIILNGDNVADPSIQNEGELRQLLKELTDYLEEKEIYWIHVYGNHDGEMKLPMTQQERVYEAYPHCLSKGSNVRDCGLGNYVVPLYGSEDEDVKFVIWALNSGDYLSAKDRRELFPDGKTPFPGNSAPTYDYIHSDQIEWYEEISRLLQDQNGGELVPGLMAFHIPLQETYTAWINRNGLEWTGQKGGDVGSSPYNSGFFEVLRRRGDVKVIVNGHDHANDFMVNYGGIKLCYCSTASTNAHHDPSILGTRIFVIRESAPQDVETYMVYVKDID